ncbi:MAG: ABC transporter ATP-binding protein [Acidimicrobiales bacterium]
MATTDVATETARAAASSALQAVKDFGQGDTSVRALNGIDVAFDAGRFSSIMGPSGSGKSTLLHCLAALEPLTSGRAFLGGTDLSDLNDAELTVLRRDRIGFVFQTFNLVPTLSAEKNITLQRRLARETVDPEWFDTVIDSLQLRDRLHHRPSELSGGQQQRVAVARALINRPDIIFADEPTGNLDSSSGHEVLGFLRRAVDDFGQTVVMVTHDPVATGYADRVVFLEDGAIVDEMQDPTTSRVLNKLGQLGS